MLFFTSIGKISSFIRIWLHTPFSLDCVLRKSLNLFMFFQANKVQLKKFHTFLENNLSYNTTIRRDCLATCMIICPFHMHILLPTFLYEMKAQRFGVDWYIFYDLPSSTLLFHQVILYYITTWIFHGKTSSEFVIIRRISTAAAHYFNKLYFSILLRWNN